jgi:putative redox protein
MTATITYLGDLRTEAVRLASGNKITTDAPIDNHGKGEAFSPTDLFATSLASCALTIMGIAANTHHINMVGTRIDMQKIMSSAPPRKVARIELSVHFPAHNYSAKERAILENAATTCPVSLSIGDAVAVDFAFHYA